jgi:hypothetical protein
MADFWTGKLDLADNDLIVHSTLATRNSQLATLSSQIASARNTSPDLWGGTGVTTSTATSLTGLAIALNDDGSGIPLRGEFNGVAVDQNSILIKYTWNGDTNLDGKIDADDYFRIDVGFTADGALAGYVNGDFDYSGRIDADDYFLIDSAFAGQGMVLAVPEPGMGGLMVFFGMMGIKRRRRL